MVEKKDKKAVISSIFCLIVVYAYTIFFTFFALIGKKYGEAYLAIYSIAICLISSILFLKYYSKKRSVNITEIFLVLFIIFVIIAYFISDTIYGYNATAEGTIQDFIVRVIPAILVGMIVANKQMLHKVAKYAPIILCYFSVCASKMIFLSFINGYSTKLWDTVFFYNYQNASYMGAYGFGIALYLLFIDKRKKSFFIRTLYMYALIINTILSIYSGGRGGVVVIVFYCIALFTYNAFIIKRAQKVFITLIFFSVILLVLGRISASNSQVLSGITRAFEFINPSGGINWEGTSGRQSIYKDSLKLIQGSPIIGYGITGAPRNGIERTHNIIFDILIDGGIIYFMFWIATITKSVTFLCKSCKYDSSNALVLVFLIGDFLMLNFSSVYMRSSAMWFALAYALVARKKIRKRFDNYLETEK